MANKKIIIGNWKMNPLSIKEAEHIFKLVSKNDKKKVGVVVCPPALYIERLKKISKSISIGAQDAFWEEKGAFTGEISSEMLYNFGARYVILGHSEKRAGGETNDEINKKIKLALKVGLVPILCVGEKARDESHEYFNIVKNQIEECLTGVVKSSLLKVIVAYEPVWAIGKNSIREATPEEFHEMSIFIRKILSDKFGSKISMPRIIYGGSVHPENALGFLMEGHAEGFLVGRDSLDPKKFLKIIEIANNF